MKIRIDKSTACGNITAPPSKSIAHRLLICAAMAEGVSVVRGISDCEDVKATLDCIHSLGVKYKINQKDITVYGMNPKNMKPISPLECRESGSTLRFMLPIALLC